MFPQQPRSLPGSSLPRLLGVWAPTPSPLTTPYRSVHSGPHCFCSGDTPQPWSVPSITV